MLVIFLCIMAFGAAFIGGCGSQNGESDTDDAATDIDADGEAGECEPGELCIPFEWSCDGDGDPVECSESGDAWLPREPCATGQTCDPETGWCECGPCEVPVEGGCERVGAQCVEGWVDDGECGCEPILDECAEDEIALIGGGWVRVGAHDDCGTGTWGNIPTDESTIYVDKSYSGGDSDGTRDKPYTWIFSAIDAVPDGLIEPVQIAIASGIYNERNSILKPVALIGRCPSMVIISPPGGALQAFFIEADNSSVSSLTVDCNNSNPIGIALSSATGLSVENVVVRSVAQTGILCQECEFEARNVSVSDIDSSGSSAYGYGINAHPGAGTNCSMTIRGADIARVGANGVYTSDCATEVYESRITGTGSAGIAVNAPRSRQPVTLSGNVIIDSHIGAVMISANPGADVVDTHITNNIIQNVLEHSLHTEGQAIGVTSQESSVTVSGNILYDSAELGVLVNAPSITVENNRLYGILGRGMQLSGDDETVVGGNTIVNTHDVGIMAGGNAVQVTRNTVRGVEPTSGEPDADGLHLQDCIGCTASENIVSDSAGFGISIRDASGEINISNNLVKELHPDSTDAAGCTGISATRYSSDTVATVSGNRVKNGALGIGCGYCDGCSFSVSDNSIGPLDLFWNDPAGPRMAVGIALFSVGEAEVSGNRVAIDASSYSDVWSHGLGLRDAAGTITGNRVTGFGTAGIGYVAEADFASLDVHIDSNYIVGGSGAGMLIERLDGGLTLIEDNVVAGIDTKPWPSGLTFGDGIAIIHASASAMAMIKSNQVISNGRFGIFVSDAAAELEMNEIRWNLMSMGWQDEADVTYQENNVWCNNRDQSDTEGGHDVPDAPAVSMP